MRAVLQRVSEASVRVENRVVGAIGLGLLVLLGVSPRDGAAEAQLLAEKAVHMRIFADEEGKFNRSLLDVGGSMLVVSQFTLYADTRKGRRPSFLGAAAPELAAPLVEQFRAAVAAYGVSTASGQFGAMMDVTLTNAGPVTIILDSDEFTRPRRE